MSSTIRVIVGLSGGVDSAVAALLLKQRGYAVEGLFMANWEDDDDDTYCTTAQDFQDARQVCQRLDIPLHKVNFAAEYRERVFSYFLEEYAAGRTPNPDVLCNSEIKFKAFLEYALRLGADYIATGHYARTRSDIHGTHLLKAADATKDQSYFLHAVPQTALAKTLFPLGDMQKHEVRTQARTHGFANHDKKDSTGICFIGERHFREFLSRYLPAKPGEIRNEIGEVLGTHQGLMYYTLGQRQGLGIGGRRGTELAPWYVAGKDLEHNVLTVVQGHEHPALLQSGLTATKMHWIAGAVPEQNFNCTAKTRYRQTDQVCHVHLHHNGDCDVDFERPQRAVTPGQYVVFYREDECLGGGIIQTTTRSARLAAARKTA